jgi:hypothetical protein
VAPRHVGYHTGAMRAVLIGAAGLVLAAAPQADAQPGKKVEIVSVTGCLREQGADTWMLVAATEPVSSIANAPPASELPKTAPDGKLSFRLIGVGEFKLPTLKDRTVVVKGLLIKDTPSSRLNVTSVAEALPSCAPSAPK